MNAMLYALDDEIFMITVFPLNAVFSNWKMIFLWIADFLSFSCLSPYCLYMCLSIYSFCLSECIFPFVSLLIINYVARMHSSSLFKYFVGSSWISRDPSMWLYCIQVYAEQMYFQLSNWYFPRYYLPESMLLVKKIPDGN